MCAAKTKYYCFLFEHSNDCLEPKWLRMHIRSFLLLSEKLYTRTQGSTGRGTYWLYPRRALRPCSPPRLPHELNRFFSAWRSCEAAWSTAWLDGAQFGATSLLRHLEVERQWLSVDHCPHSKTVHGHHGSFLHILCFESQKLLECVDRWHHK